VSEVTFLGEAAIVPAKDRPAVLAYGTSVSEDWDDAWLNLVRSVERVEGKAICGAKRTSVEMDSLVRTGKLAESDRDLEESWVCRLRAGMETQHVGRDRCFKHGGITDANKGFAMISDPVLAGRVHEFLENDVLLDLRGAIAMAWAAADSIMSNADGDLSLTQAKEVGALMSRIGNLTKQHNEIMEKRKIQIDVPEFIAWAEHFYELAIKYILDGTKDVQGFLTEAKSYYDATVTLKVGVDPSGERYRESHPFGGDSAQPVLGAGEPDPERPEG